jgi:hypothetical protein
MVKNTFEVGSIYFAQSYFNKHISKNVNLTPVVNRF